MANNPETLAQLYGLFLYRKKDIIDIQEKLGIGGNINQLVVPPDSELMGKTLADSYEMLLELVGNLMPIQKNLNIDGNPVLEVELRRDKASSDKPIRLFDLLLYLEDDIVTIQKKLGMLAILIKKGQKKPMKMQEHISESLRNTMALRK